MSPSINTDVLVIGSGLAGATAAITAADEGENGLAYWVRFILIRIIGIPISI
jgi:succinate dehydrogenase/fumarate reductase flavoprotein subunit